MTSKVFEAKASSYYGESIKYTDDTEFLIQIGKDKGSYKTKWRIKGNLSQSHLYYESLNVAGGFKKRLVMTTSVKPIVLRRVITAKGF